jgi:hypothetical protein
LFSVGVGCCIAGPVATESARVSQVTPADTVRSESEKKLIAQIESLKAAVSEIRGKKFIENLQVGIKTRDELRRYITEKLQKSEAAGEIERVLKVLVKLGLASPGLDLKKAMLDMLVEQLGGFYDAETKALYVVEKTPGKDMPAYVIAHEIFHALQDQYFHIGAMVKAIRRDGDHTLAAWAIIEGEATLGGLEFRAQKDGLSVITAPGEIGRTYRRGFEADLKKRPDSALARAPRFVREMLLFRYCEGTSFVQQALRKYKSFKELDRLFENPPLSTEQIMHPEKYLDKMDYPVRILLPQLHRQLEGDWAEVMTSTMGEFNIRVILSEFIGSEAAAADAAGWDGDSYTLIESRGDSATQIFAWLSVWDSASDAEEFAASYALALSRRFKSEYQKTQTGYFLKGKAGTETAVVEFAGEQVLVIEGAPESLAPKVRAVLLKARQVVMDEHGFEELAGQKQALPIAPAGNEAPPPGQEPAKNDH